MDNVIFVDFRNKHILGKKIYETDFSSLDEYFNFLLSEGLEMDDILDINDAIQDADFYMQADPVVQDLANFWFSHSNQL
jgi:hypothetical protein